MYQYIKLQYIYACTATSMMSEVLSWWHADGCTAAHTRVNLHEYT